MESFENVRIHIFFFSSQPFGVSILLFNKFELLWVIHCLMETKFKNSVDLQWQKY